MFAPGQQLGAYRITDPLGSGGMGTVYAAIDPSVGPVAIKVLHPHLAERHEAVSAVMREAQIVNRIQHPGLVGVFDFGTSPDGLPYLVMPLLQGETLGALLNRLGTLPLQEVLAIADAIASAVDAAHARQVIHCDLKPENVFLVSARDGDRHVRVLDFGVARLSFEDVALGARGTPGYMAPEQFGGGDPLWPAVDVYALGVIVYRALLGRVPFPGGLMEVAAQHVSGAEPMLPSLLGAPPELDRPILDCLARDPNARPATLSLAVARLAEAARATSEALEFQGFGPESSKLDGVAVSGSAPVQKAPSARTVAVRFALWTALGTTVVAALVYSGLYAFAPHESSRAPSSEKFEASNAKEPLPVASEDPAPERGAETDAALAAKVVDALRAMAAPSRSRPSPDEPLETLLRPGGDGDRRLQRLSETFDRAVEASTLLGIDWTHVQPLSTAEGREDAEFGPDGTPVLVKFSASGTLYEVNAEFERDRHWYVKSLGHLVRPGMLEVVTKRSRCQLTLPSGYRPHLVRRLVKELDGESVERVRTYALRDRSDGAPVALVMEVMSFTPGVFADVPDDELLATAADVLTSGPTEGDWEFLREVRVGASPGLEGVREFGPLRVLVRVVRVGDEIVLFGVEGSASQGTGALRSTALEFFPSFRAKRI